MKRVLHVTSEYPPVVHGGLGRHVEGLTRAQAADGASVHVLAPADDLVGRSRAAAPALAWWAGVEVRRVPSGPTASGVAHLVEAANALQRAMVEAADHVPAVDVVHAHDWMTADASRAIATARGVPLVLTLHATEHGRRCGRLDEPVPRAVHAAERRAVSAADRVVVCSAAMRDEALAHGAHSADVHVVPGGVDLDAWRVDALAAAEARRRWAPSDDHLVVAAGRLEWEKGFSTLLRALPALVAAQPSTRVVLAGTGSYAPVLGELARQLGVQHRVVWPGRLGTSELAALFAAADTVVVPSRYEPFGLVAAEAQATGAAVVVTRTGGLAELVDDGVTGRVVDPGDVDRLAQVLAELLADPAARRRLGDAARAVSAGRGWPVVAAALRAVYGT